MGNQKRIRQEKLDNTANLFPVIATEQMTNVYRLAITLKESVQPELLQEALHAILPKFQYMNLRIRTGIFWYYFETNINDAPKVMEETDFPCRKFDLHKNKYYLFSVTYYKCRINLEVFHVLADGMGGINFLRELVYEYLRRAHPEDQAIANDTISEKTSFNREDSYLKNFRATSPNGYKSKPAVHVTGSRFPKGMLGVIHGYLSVQELKDKSRALGVSINEYLAGIYAYSIYKEQLHGMPSKDPIVVCVPVNLRPYFDSITTRNFFVMVSVDFLPTKEDYTPEEVIQVVAEGLRVQMNKENLETLFSYNVSNQKNLILRAVPLVLKKIAIRAVYRTNAKATTTTLTNVGNLQIDPRYQSYISHFQAILSISTGQNIKAAVCSYQDIFCLTFSTDLNDLSVPARCFRTLRSMGLSVKVESNGAWDE